MAEQVLFADEAGSWQVGVDWRTVLPAWFRCLAATAQADEYAVAVREAIADFIAYDAEHFIEAARQAATTDEQHAALDR